VTELTRTFGADKARIILAHDADSRVLEEYYVDYSPETAITTASNIRWISRRRNCSDGSYQCSSCHIQVDPEAVKRTHGAALNALILFFSQTLSAVSSKHFLINPWTKLLIWKTIKRSEARCVCQRWDSCWKSEGVLCFQWCLTIADYVSEPSLHDTLREHMNGLYDTPKIKFSRWLEVDWMARGIEDEPCACLHCPSNEHSYGSEKTPFTTLSNPQPKTQVFSLMIRSVVTVGAIRLGQKLSVTP